MDSPRYDSHRRRLFQIYCNVCGEIVWKRAGVRFCSKSCSNKRAHEEQPRTMPKGEQHYAWKGEGAGYQAMHQRVLRERGQAVGCEQREEAGCTSVKYEWAHIHGTDPGDPANYRSLCKSCHIIYDGQDGSGHANARLSPDQVREIRERYEAGGISQAALGAEYGVTQGTISNLLRGKRYKAA